MYGAGFRQPDHSCTGSHCILRTLKTSILNPLAFPNVLDKTVKISHVIKSYPSGASSFNILHAETRSPREALSPCVKVVLRTGTVPLSEF